MQAVLLAAGKSSRFYPFNQNLDHKSLMVVMGKTLIERTVENLEGCGINEIIIVVGKNSLIPKALGHIKSSKIIYVEQNNPNGMGDALLQAKNHLQESFFVLGSYHFDISDFAKEMLTCGKASNAVVLVKKDEILYRYGNVVIDGDKILEIVEKPQYSRKGSYRLASIYFLQKEFIREIENIPSEEYSFEKALNKFAKKNKVFALKTEKQTITLKYVWDLLSAKDYIFSNLERSSISKSASVAKSSIISGNVIIDDGAEILEGACIKGPAYIGKNVTVGNRAILRNGVVVETNSTIGSQMEVKNSIILSSTTTHSGFIGDSIVGNFTKIAGGFITANARLDRQNIFVDLNGEKVDTGLSRFGAIIGDNNNIGIRVSTMPGVIIGNKVTVGPSTTIMKNIPQNVKYYTKFKEIIEENNAR